MPIANCKQYRVYEKRIAVMRDILRIQKENVGHSEYMRGIYNALLFADYTMRGDRTPIEFLSRQKEPNIFIKTKNKINLWWLRKTKKDIQELNPDRCHLCDEYRSICRCNSQGDI